MTEGTDFLYPFIEGDERDAGRAARRPRGVGGGQGAAERRAARRHARPQLGDRRRRGRAPMAERFAPGGRLFTFGNGGSSTDAASLAALFGRPPPGARSRPGAWPTTRRCSPRSANDVGFDLVFSRQLIAHAGPGDIAVGISTSGNSRNLLAAFDEARARGPAHGRLGRLRRRRDGARARDVDALPRRRVRQRAPHPGGAGGARLRACGGGPGARSARTRPVADAAAPTPATAKPRCSTASRLPPPPAAPHRRRRHPGPRRRRQGVGRAGRRGVPRRVRRRRPAAAARRGDAVARRRASGWRSPPTRSSCSRCGSRAARSATSRCTAR